MSSDTGKRILCGTGVTLSLLVLAAHFLRGGNMLVVLVFLAAPWLLLVRATWAVRALQTLLVVGALEWLRTLVVLTSARLRAGEDYLRMGLILGTVLAVALLSAICLSRRIPPDSSEPTGD